MKHVGAELPPALSDFRTVKGRGLESPEQYAERCRTEGERNRAITERLREAIQRLKASRNPASESALLRSIRELGHPDVEGLLGALQARDTQPGPMASRPRKGA